MWSLVIVAYVVFVVNTFFANKLIHYGLRKQLQDVFKPMMFSILSFSLVYFFFPTGGGLFTMFVQTMVFVGMYFLLACIFSLKELKVVFNFLKHKNRWRCCVDWCVYFFMYCFMWIYKRHFIWILRCCHLNKRCVYLCLCMARRGLERWEVVLSFKDVFPQGW